MHHVHVCVEMTSTAGVHTTFLAQGWHCYHYTTIITTRTIMTSHCPHFTNTIRKKFSEKYLNHDWTEIEGSGCARQNGWRSTDKEPLSSVRTASLIHPHHPLIMQVKTSYVESHEHGSLRGEPRTLHCRGCLVSVTKEVIGFL